MKANWTAAMTVELRFEGGKVDHPKDPGGRTNQGVIQRVFSAYLLAKGHPARDVYTMTPAERDEIYAQQYGKKIGFDSLPPGVDLVVLDGAINSGVSQSVKWLQRELGLSADGVMGDVTLAACQNYPDHDLLIAGICNRRLAFLKALKTWPDFGKGWTSRISQVRLKGQAWASGSIGPDVAFVADANQKAFVTQAKAAPSRAFADYTSSSGVVTTSLSTAQETLQPLGGTPFVDSLVKVLIVTGIVVTMLGLAYGWYARRKKAELEDVLDLVPQAAPNNNDQTPDEILSISDAPLAYQGAPEIAGQ